MAHQSASLCQKVGPGQILHVEPKQAVFMPYPGWHQSNPRYYLSIEMATPHGVAFVDVPTTLSQYSFPPISMPIRTNYSIGKRRGWIGVGQVGVLCADLIDRIIIATIASAFLWSSLTLRGGDGVDDRSVSRSRVYAKLVADIRAYCRCR